jgi:hypothetical protein
MFKNKNLATLETAPKSRQKGFSLARRSKHDLIGKLFL